MIGLIEAWRLNQRTPIPRPIIVRVHHDQVRREIHRLSREKGELYFRQRRVHIFQDWPPDVARRRAAFKDVKAKMKDLPGVRYGLLPTGKLQVTFQGKREVFDKPEDAETFFNQTIAPLLKATTSDATASGENGIDPQCD